MVGLSITDLPHIAGYNLGRVTGKGRTCETEQSARQEDQRRAQLLRISAREATKPANREAAEELADLLDYREEDPPRTPASKLYMLYAREPVLGHVSKLCAETSLTVASCHLEPLRQELGGSELNTLDAITESDVLRAALNGAGLASFAGAAILFQDLEHEARTDVWRGGRHGLVFGEKIEAFEALRSTRNYSPRLCEGRVRRRPRIRIIRRITNLDYHLSYLFKGSVYGRWEGYIDGEWVRSRKRRIPGYRHSQSLLWLHSHSAQDLCQLIGMRIGREGFFFTNDEPRRRLEVSGAVAF